MVTFTQEVEKAIAARKRVEEGQAWARVSAYVILHPDKVGHGIIRVAHAKDGMGPTHVFMWDPDGSGIQYSSRAGCGYDKVGSALSGMTFDGKELGDNWQVALRERGYEIIQAI